MQKKLFGTDGIRGLANVFPLEPQLIVRLGQAIATHFLTDSTRHSVLIGKDTRLSGYMIEYSLAAGLTSAGANVYLTGPIPTAGVAYLTRSMRADAGIMVSASHNPYEDNGIKIFGADGFKLPDEVEEKISAMLTSKKDLVADIKPQGIGKIKRIDDAQGRYIVSLKSFFPRNLNLKGLRIGLDCANGAAYQVAPLVFDELGADVVTRGVSPNGKNINAGFGSLFPEVVGALVKDQNLDVGFAFDGDADRLVVADENGRVVQGDELLALFASYYGAKNKLKNNAIVATVMSNIGLDAFLETRGIKVIRSQVGDRYVLEQLRQNSLSLGGETSGHIIFLDDSTCGDGILCALKVLQIMKETGKPLSQLLDSFHMYPQKLINLNVREKVPFDKISGYPEMLKNSEKDLEGKGRILIRYSGTENKVRILVEAQEAKDCEVHAKRFADLLKEQLGTNA